MCLTIPEQDKDQVGKWQESKPIISNNWPERTSVSMDLSYPAAKRWEWCWAEGEHKNKPAQALKQVGHASFSRASSIFLNEEYIH